MPKPNREFELKNWAFPLKHGGGSQTIWGCMSSVRIGNLHFIDENGQIYVFKNFKTKFETECSKNGYITT